MQKQYQKNLKHGHKQKPKQSSGQPNGFAMPSYISPELCDFLQVPHGTEMARTEVTQKLTAYTQVHKLQNPSNKRELIPDAKLKELLQPGAEPVTYFNLQKYMKKHYINPNPNETLSAPLCDFLSVPHDTKLMRKQVVKQVCAYVKQNGLQDQQNKNIILVDAKLKSLLQSKDGDSVTYLNLNEYLRKHYQKA